MNIVAFSILYFQEYHTLKLIFPEKHKVQLKLSLILDYVVTRRGIRNCANQTREVINGMV